MKNFFLLAITFLTLGISINSCNKKKVEEPKPVLLVDPELNELSEHFADEAIIRTETDEIIDNALHVIAKFGDVNTKEQATCGLKIDSSLWKSGSIKLIYNGLSCDSSYNRTGTVIVNFLPFKFTGIGTEFTLKFDKLTLINKKNTQKVVLSGEKTIRNATIGYPHWALNGKMNDLSGKAYLFSHTINASKFIVTFSDTATCTWDISRKRTFSKDTIKITSSADNGVISSGINKNKKTFSTKIEQALILQFCESKDKIKKPKLISGKFRTKVRDQDISTSFGFNSSGSLASNTCDANFFKINWIRNNLNADEKLLEIVR